MIINRFVIPAFSFCLLFVSCKQEEQPETPPNIVLILADDLGYNDISIYRETSGSNGPEAPTTQTPAIDQMAREGMRFTDFYAGAAVCSPSRAALLTGRNCNRLGIYNWIPPNQPMHLRAQELTMAEILKAKAYQTGHFGKWHLTSEGMGQPLPNEQGYDYSFFAYNNANPSHKDPVNYFRNGEPVGPLQGFACQLVMDEALNWLEQRNPDQPFYINVWFNEPHEKVEAPEALKARHQHHQAYYGAIENLDSAIARLTSYLEAKGLAENTLVVFTSDNGSQVYHSNDPFRGAKCFNYEGGLRVPFVVKWPGKVPAETVNGLPGSFPDLVPSIAAIAGVDLPTDRVYDGTDLSGVFSGKTNQVERNIPIFFYRYFHDPVTMLREGKWNLLGFSKPMPYIDGPFNAKELANLKPSEENPTWSAWNFQENHMPFIQQQEIVAFELYNLEDDPHQEHNVIEQHPAIAAPLQKRMLQLKQEMIAEGGDWFAGATPVQ